MEDEEGSTALNAQPRNEQSQSPQNQEPKTVTRYRPWYWIIAGAGGAVILLLVGVSISFICEKTLDCQKAHSETGDYSHLETIIRLRRFLCRPHGNNASACKFCPEKWLRYKNKCYWLSKEKQSWQKSKDDCEEKHAQMLVIQSPEEQAFVLRMIGQGKHVPWLGRKMTSPKGEWPWVDDSPINNTVLQASGTAQPNSCDMLKGNRIISEACDTKAEWICVRETFMV